MHKYQFKIQTVLVAVSGQDEHVHTSNMHLNTPTGYPEVLVATKAGI